MKKPKNYQQKTQKVREEVLFDGGIVHTPEGNIPLVGRALSKEVRDRIKAKARAGEISNKKAVEAVLRAAQYSQSEEYVIEVDQAQAQEL